MNHTAFSVWQWGGRLLILIGLTCAGLGGCYKKDFDYPDRPTFVGAPTSDTGAVYELRVASLAGSVPRMLAFLSADYKAWKFRGEVTTADQITEWREVFSRNLVTVRRLSWSAKDEWAERDDLKADDLEPDEVNQAVLMPHPVLTRYARLLVTTIDPALGGNLTQKQYDVLAVEEAGVWRMDRFAPRRAVDRSSPKAAVAQLLQACLSRDKIQMWDGLTRAAIRRWYSQILLGSLVEPPTFTVPFNRLADALGGGYDPVTLNFKSEKAASITITARRNANDLGTPLKLFLVKEGDDWLVDISEDDEPLFFETLLR